MTLYGIAGTNGAGKDVVATFLRDKYGFCFADATAMLAEELQRRGLPTERINKSTLSAEWRREYGMAAIVDRGIAMFEAGDYKGLIVGSLRHPGENIRVHELGGKVIWVDADPEVRYKRVTSNNRGRVEDQKTYEEFLADQEREMHPTGDAATLNIAGVKEKSDIFIYNNSDDVEQFCHEVEKALGLN